MFLWSFALLLCFLANDSVALSQSVSSTEYTKASGPVLVSNATSSEVITLTGVQWQVQCLIRCLSVRCPLASFIPSSRQCQLLLVNDASQEPWPAGTHAEFLMGSEDGAEVWTVKNFSEFITKRLQNITMVFQNSGTGRFGSIQFLTIPSSGCYRIEASGAKGGTNSGRAGGNGAVMSGTFSLTSLTELTVVVGQAGGPPRSLYSGGGGGGGSFVYRTVDSLLLIAAGGGGSGTSSAAGLPGEAGTNGSSVESCAMPTCYKGTDGQPGYNDPSLMPFTHNHGGCGAGWLGKPVNARRSNNDGDGGGSRAEGWVGGAAGRSNTGVGGFGGGGGGGDFTTVYAASGAGGGFSGGATSYFTSWPGGGGGSFCSGSDCIGITGGNTDQHGKVVIRLIRALC